MRKETGRPLAVIINDTRRDIGHIGCEAVMRNLVQLCAANGLRSVTFQSPSCSDSPAFKETLSKADCLILNGEGTMHRDRPNALLLMRAVSIAKELGLPCYLVNSIWQENPLLTRCVDLFDRVYVRDGRSAENLLSAGHKAKVVPDLSLYRDASFRKPEADASRILVVDSVVPSMDILLRKTAGLLGARYARMRIQRNFIGRSRLPAVFLSALCGRPLREDELVCGVVTGRFHAVCLSMKLGLPFLAVESNTYKIQAMLLDAGIDPQACMAPPFCNPSDLASLAKKLREWPQPLAEKVERFVTKAQGLIEDMVREIAMDVAGRAGVIEGKGE